MRLALLSPLQTPYPVSPSYTEDRLPLCVQGCLCARQAGATSLVPISSSQQLCMGPNRITAGLLSHPHTHGTLQQAHFRARAPNSHSKTWTEFAHPTCVYLSTLLSPIHSPVILKAPTLCQLMEQTWVAATLATGLLAV